MATVRSFKDCVKWYQKIKQKLVSVFSFDRVCFPIFNFLAFSPYRNFCVEEKKCII